MLTVDPIAIGPFSKGINTRLPSFALDKNQLRNAVNVDLDNAGHVHRRAGAVKTTAGASVRSLWFDGENGPGYFADGAQIKRFRAEGAPPYPADVVTACTAGAPVVFERRDTSIYWTDGTLTGQILDSGTAQAWGITPPPDTLSLAQIPGSLFDGQYQITYTYVRANGEQSGAPLTVSTNISHSDRTQDGTAGILVSGITASADPTVVAIKVFCTGANGTGAPMCVATLPNASGSYAITQVQSGLGESLQTQYITPPPAGKALFSHGSRMYVVQGNWLFYSEPFTPSWFNPAFNHITFPSPIAVGLPVRDGIHVATADTHYFLPGLDPLKMSLQKVLPYGAVPGSGVVIRNGQQVAWMSPRGIVLAGPEGQAKAVQEDQIAVELAQAGVTGYRETNGMRQLVAILTGTQPAAMNHKDFNEQEARRKATVLPQG